MPINVFGNSLNNSDSKIDTSRFVQKSYLRHNYIETDIDHDINLKNQYRIINSLQPINDNDIVNKIYIDTKIADMIKKNIQNDDYISFLDNDNVEYKLEKYKPKILLTNISLFNSNAAPTCNNLWGYYTQTGELTSIIQALGYGTPNAWLTGPSVLYENLPYLSFHSYFLTTNTYAEISRYDIYNITNLELVINRYSTNNIMGETSVLYKNKKDEWIELHKIVENTDISTRDGWDIITLTVNEDNYGIKIRHNKKNSTSQILSISKITLTYTV